MSKVCLITGSSRGLGRAFAEAARKADENVAVTARNPDDLADLKQRFGNQALCLELDITSESQASDAVKQTIDKFGTLDVLVNNAGYTPVSLEQKLPNSVLSRRSQHETQKEPNSMHVSGIESPYSNVTPQSTKPSQNGGSSATTSAAPARMLCSSSRPM